MTDREILNELDLQRNAAFAALAAVEQRAGTMGLQSIVARAYWWGIEETYKYIKSLVEPARTPSTINTTVSKGEQEHEN